MSEPGMDWLLRPVDAGYILYTSLLNGEVNLSDVARMNDAITVKMENQARAEKSARTQ
jgi:hypothetical protein